MPWLSGGGRDRKDPPLEVSGGMWPCQHVDFGFLTSRTVREWVSVLSNSICTTFFNVGSSRKLIWCSINIY